MDNREEVRDSCSVRLCVRRASVVAVLIPVETDEVVGAKSSARGLRDRRVEDSIVDSSWVSCISLLDSSFDRGSGFRDSVDCAIDDAVGGGVGSFWSSVDVSSPSPGVSSPKRSSPSDDPSESNS
jgi:hypothetical protein